MYVVHARFSRNDVRVYFFVVKKKELGRLKNIKNVTLNDMFTQPSIANISRS